MAEKVELANAGWLVGRSIAMELDVVLTGLHGSDWSAIFTKEFPAIAERVPAGMLEEWRQAFGRKRGWTSFLETLAFLGGVFFEGEYQKATLVMRGFSLDQVLARLRELALPYGLTIRRDLPENEQMIDLGTALFASLYTNLGMKLTNIEAFNRNNRRDFIQLSRILKDGDLHDWFWMWLDRFFFETYKEWRETRFDLMDHNEAHANMELGAKERRGEVPKIDWLPDQNPLKLQSAYIESARLGKLITFFWVDPFGLADNWTLYPGYIAVSFSEPGEIYQRFFQNTMELATRIQALADPTRLGILRLIRHFGMINTEIGKFMGISRPTVSIHAKQLREAGLIRSYEQGRETRHEIVPGELQRMFHDLEAFLDLPEEDTDAKS
jgi:DNA-binding transcriptional ArsR family regulator